MENLQESRKDKIKRALYLIGGSIAFVLGVIGLFLPLLPTTPFILLAAACYLRSSRKMYDYVTNHKLFGRYIRNYENGVMEKKDKYRTLTILWIGIIFSVFLIDKMFVKGILIAIAIGVTIHLNHLKAV
ncbi:MAG: YbaN family protein [Gallicola sp.]|nr:YbaN family protein [Gallicola sp.]